MNRQKHKTIKITRLWRNPRPKRAQKLLSQERRQFRRKKWRPQFGWQKVRPHFHTLTPGIVGRRNQTEEAPLVDQTVKLKTKSCSSFFFTRYFFSIIFFCSRFFFWLKSWCHNVTTTLHNSTDFFTFAKRENKSLYKIYLTCRTLI